jgi:hypothetical protein
LGVQKKREGSSTAQHYLCLGKEKKKGVSREIKEGPFSFPYPRKRISEPTGAIGFKRS